MLITFDKASARRTDENGFLHLEETNISKATVNPYYGSEIPGSEALGLDPKKIYKLLRDPDELKKAASTFNNLPVLDKHIPVSAMDLNDEDIKKHVVGSTGTEAEFVAPYLRNSMVLHTASAIKDVEAGSKAELSCAYRYEPVMTSGTYEGQTYDGIMTNLRGNHVALVTEGRAGHDVKVMDAQIKLTSEIPGYSRISEALGLLPTVEERISIALGMDYTQEQVRDDHGRWAVGEGRTGGGSVKITGKSKKEGGTGTKVVYLDKNGKPLSAALQKQAAEAKVPPAYVNIHLPKHKDDPIRWKAQRWIPPQGSKPGRWKWEQKMSAALDSKADREKFNRAKAFGKDVAKVAAATKTDVAKGNHAAAAVRAMMLTGMRVGGKDSAERTYSHTVKSTVRGEKGKKEEQEGHFGATTLQKEHVSVKGDRVTMSFNGKHGVANEKVIVDKPLATFMKDRLPQIGKGEKVFNTSPAKTMEYLSKSTGKKYENKDLRTWQGTQKTIELLAGRVAKNEKQFKDLQKEISTGVSQHLSNSPKIALTKYIDPIVWKTARGFK